MNAFADGLRLDQLHPPGVITFLQGLTRRVGDQLIESAASAGVPSARSIAGVESIHKALARATTTLEQTGHPSNRNIEDFASPAIETDPELSRLNAAALEMARRVGGVPDEVWTSQPELLELVRTTCGQVAELLDQIGEPADAGGASPPEPHTSTH